MLEGVVLISTSLVFILLGSVILDVRDILLYSFIVGLVETPFCLFFAGTQIGYLHKKLGNVYFDGETISIFDPTHGCDYTAKLADCQWFVGSRTWATVPFREYLFGIGTGKALLIVFPDSIRTPELRIGQEDYAEGPVIIAVGLTIETRFQWEQAIERLRVEKDTRRESLSPPVSLEFLTMWMFVAFGISWWTGIGISSMTLLLLTQWNVPADIAIGISFPLFIPGTINMFVFLVLVSSCWREKQDVHRVPRGRKHQWQAITGIGCAHGLVVLKLWMGGGNDWTARSSIIATVICIAMAIVFMVASWQIFAGEQEDAIMNREG